ncbi:MAG: hypothetical protein AAFY47_06465 [Pseudomonadota bacterium]
MSAPRPASDPGQRPIERPVERAEGSASEIVAEPPQGSSFRRKLAEGPNSIAARQDRYSGAENDQPAFEEEPVASDFRDPLSDEASAQIGSDFHGDPLGEHDSTPFDDEFENAFEDAGYEDADESQFAYRAPFTGRRNPVKMWTLAAAIFALMASGTVVAVNYYGLPDWLPFSRANFGVGKPDLVLNFPKAEQGEVEVQPGVEIFQVRGSIDNVGRESLAVPQLVIVFTDAAGKRVFSKVIVPAKDTLAPGESLKVTEGVSGYPDAAKKAGIGWAPN